MSLFKILRFFVPGAQGHFRIFFAAVGVTFLGVSFFPAVCVLFRCALEGERCVGKEVGVKIS